MYRFFMPISISQFHVISDRLRKPFAFFFVCFSQSFINNCCKVFTKVALLSSLCTWIRKRRRFLKQPFFCRRRVGRFHVQIKVCNKVRSETRRKSARARQSSTPRRNLSQTTAFGDPKVNATCRFQCKNTIMALNFPYRAKGSRKAYFIVFHRGNSSVVNRECKGLVACRQLRRDAVSQLAQHFGNPRHVDNLD